MTVLIIIFLILFLFLLSVSILLLIVGPIILLQPRIRKYDFYEKMDHPTKPEDLELKYELINIPVEDNIHLHTWIIRATENVRGTLIYLHGVGDCKIAGLPFTKFFSEHGYDIVLYDSRRHGESSGKYCTYGYYEKYDLIKVIDYLIKNNKLRNEKIGSFGTSMGAAVALQTAAIDKRILAVVAENSFSTLRKIFDDYQKRMTKIPFHYLRNFVIIRSESIANFKAREVSPLESVKKIKIPLLFVCSKNDKHINHQYTLKLFEAADTKKELYIIENATHVDAWEVGGIDYHRKILDFYRENL